MVMRGVGMAAALALALWAWWPADDAASGKKNAKPRSPSAGSIASLDSRPPAMATTAPSLPSWASPSTTMVNAGPITLAAPQRLFVGETNELVVGVGANAGINEISFTLEFDPNVLQGRLGTEGDRAADAGVDARSFAVEISDAGDRVQIRSAVSGQRGMAGGSVAIVQFQAVGPGTTSVLVTDMVVKDAAGKPLAPTGSTLRLQTTVESAPRPQPEALRQRGAVAVEPPPETSEEGD